MTTGIVKLPLSAVKPNKFRDVENYKLDQEKIQSLKASIGNTGFWPSVMIRQVGDEYELLFGHHRVEAARQALGDDYEHDFIIRHNADDTVAIRMMADENADSWAMSAQHALLCVKQARDHLNGLLQKYPTWDDALQDGQLSSLQMTDWFGEPEANGKANYSQCREHGVGRNVIEKFLGGSFSRGRGVRDALEILEGDEVDPIIAGQFTNLSQARAFKSAVTSPRGKEAGLNKPEAQKKLAEQIVSELQPQSNGVDPKRKDAPSAVPFLERLTAKSVKARVDAQIEAALSDDDEGAEPDVIADYIVAVDNVNTRARHFQNSLNIFSKAIDALPNGFDPTKVGEAIAMMEALRGQKMSLDAAIGRLEPFVKQRQVG